MGATEQVAKRLGIHREEPDPRAVAQAQVRRQEKLGLPVSEALRKAAAAEPTPAPAPAPKLRAVPVHPPTPLVTEKAETARELSPANSPAPRELGVKLTEAQREEVRKREHGRRMKQLDAILPGLEAWADLLAYDTPEEKAEKAAAAEEQKLPVHMHAEAQAEKLALEILGPVAADFIRSQGWYVASGKQYKDGAASVALSPRDEYNPLPDKFFRAMKAAGFVLDPQSHSTHAVWTKEPEPRRSE